MKYIEENPEKRKLRQVFIKMSNYGPIPNTNELVKYVKNYNILDLEIIEYGLNVIEDIKNKQKLKNPDIYVEEINVKEEVTKIMLSIIYDKTKEIKESIEKVKVYVEKNKTEIKKAKIK